MKPRERTVSFYDLRVDSRLRGEEVLPVGVPTTKALEIARRMKGNSPFSKGNATLQLTLAEWVHKEGSREHYLIFNRADASLPDIPLRDLKSGKSRMAGKATTEGIDLTAHVLIVVGKKPLDRALMLMTGGSSLPAHRVANILTRLFKNAKDLPAYAEHFFREHPSGAKDAKVSLISDFVLDGHPNETLAHILRGGGLNGIDLISDADQMLDEESALKITSTEYRVLPMKTGSSLTLARLRAAIGKAPTAVDKARVRYTKPGGSKPETHTFNVDDLDSTFVRKELIRFDVPIQPRYEKVSMEIMNKLRSLVPGA